MTDPRGESATLGLALEDRLPLSWTVCDTSNLGSLQLANQDTLRIILALEEHIPEAEERGANAPELARIDFKLNLVLDLVSKLLERHLVLPAPRLTRLTPEVVEWVADDGPSAGSNVEVQLFLCNRYPRAIVLPGRVTGTSTGADGLRTSVSFEGLGDTVKEELEKLIFRRHRRLVAQARRASSADS